MLRHSSCQAPPVVQFRRSGSGMAQSKLAFVRFRRCGRLPRQSHLLLNATAAASKIHYEASWVGTRPMMSTGPILVLAKPPKSRRPKKSTRLGNELPTTSPSADPNGRLLPRGSSRK